MLTSFDLRPLLLVLCFGASSAHANRCRLLETMEGVEVLTSYKKGQLSTYWAQEYVGSDLAKHLYQELAHRDTSLQPTPLAVVDSNLSPPLHGTKSAPSLTRRLQPKPESRI